MKTLSCLLLVTLYCGMAMAQSNPGGPPVSHKVQYLTSQEAGIDAIKPATSQPLILNEFTVAGPNVSGVPCYDCVTSANTPNLGILQPIGIVSTGVQYQLDAFLVDQNYTGSCTYTFEVVRGSTVIYSAPATFNETAPTTILLGTALTIPTGTVKGAATLSTVAVCGSSKTRSSSGLYITN